MQDTTIQSFDGRSISISDKKISLSSHTGIIPIAHIARTYGIFDSVGIFLKDAFAQKRNARYLPEQMFEQRVLALAAGYEDLNDHNRLALDPAFKVALGSDWAGNATLCRFENRFDRHQIDALNQTLLETFVSLNQRLNLLPRYRRKHYRCLFLDVDSTYLELHGNQENKSYNTHYQCSCLAPVLCYLHGYPVAVYGAAGTNDARKVLAHHLRRLLERLLQAFPDYIIVLRGDSGFNSVQIINICDELGVKYIFGLSPNQRAQHQAKEGLKYVKKKKVGRYTTNGSTYVLIGGIDYQAKSWTQKRRVIARKRFDSRTCQLDLRLIQTNIACTHDSNESGFAGELSTYTMEKLYEKGYCARGKMEKWIAEFKTECFGARASASKFHTNCYRMILSAYCQMMLKVVRRIQMLGLRKQNTKIKDRTVRTFRRDFINVASQIVERTKKVVLTLPKFLFDKDGFLALMTVPI